MCRCKLRMMVGSGKSNTRDGQLKSSGHLMVSLRIYLSAMFVEAFQTMHMLSFLSIFICYTTTMPLMQRGYYYQSSSIIIFPSLIYLVVVMPPRIIINNHKPQHQC
jgi:hypothetical protein